MIYLADKKIIFVKTMKTAGTSVEIALSANASDTDIVTRVTPLDDVLRLDPPYQFPCNWSKNKEREIAYRQWIQENRERIVKDGGRTITGRARAGRFDKLYAWISRRPFFVPGEPVFYNHMLPGEIKDRLGAADFDAAEKITITRHPYEQTVSQAWFFFRDRTEPDIDRMIDRLVDRSQRNFDMYHIDGQVIVDRFLRYEHLREDLEKLERDRGLELLKYLPVTKGIFRKNRTSAFELLTDEQKSRIYDHNRMEFELFGYER